MSGIELFKLQTSEGSGGTSSGQTRIFEDREAFEHALLVGLISAAAERDRRGSYVARRWRDLMRRRAGGHELGAGERRTLRVVGAWRMFEGEWVELQWELIEPRVEWRGAVR